jgi:hypothetical protein
MAVVGGIKAFGFPPFRDRRLYVNCGRALNRLLATDEVVADLIDTRRCVFLAYLWRAGRLIAHRLQTLLHERPLWPVIDAERAIG